VPKNSDNLEKLLRILVLVQLLRMLRPDLSAVGLGNLSGLAGGALRVSRRPLAQKRAFDLPSPSKVPEAVVTALEAVAAEPIGLQGVQPLTELLAGRGAPGQVGFRFRGPTTVLEGLQDEFTPQGFRVQEMLEPSEIAPRSVPKLVIDILKEERTREIVCVVAAPFLLKATSIPNPIVRAGALAGLAVCGVEILE